MENFKKMFLDALKNSKRLDKILVFLGLCVAISNSIKQNEANMNCLYSIALGFFATLILYFVAIIINIGIELVSKNQKYLIPVFISLAILGICIYYFTSKNKEPVEPIKATSESCKIDDCITSDNELPCWFTITDKANSSINITIELDINKTHAERIAELNRNEDGLIKEFISGERVIIPHQEEERNVEKLLCYLNELPLEVKFEKCDENAAYSRYPCIYIIKEKETNYEKLALDRYGYSNEDIIKDLIQANDFEFFINAQGVGDLRQLSTPFKIGTIVYIPALK